MQRWQSLDRYAALQAEGYWLEFCKLRQTDKANLLASLAQANATRLRIVESDLTFDQAVRSVLATSNQTAKYEQDMRRQYFASLTGQDLDDAAAAAIEVQFSLKDKLLAKMRA